MDYIASLEDIENDPELTVVGRPAPGLNAEPFVVVQGASELPTLPSELIQEPSVTVTIEAPKTVPDLASEGEVVLPEPIEVATISVDPAPEPEEF